jgi:hypothetical protein
MIEAAYLQTETGRPPRLSIGLRLVVWLDCHLMQIILSLPIVAMLACVVLTLVGNLTSTRAVDVLFVVFVALLIMFMALAARRASGQKKRASLAYVTAIDRQVKSADRKYFDARIERLLSRAKALSRDDVTTALIGARQDARDYRQALQDSTLLDAQIAVLRQTDPMGASDAT